MTTNSTPSRGGRDWIRPALIVIAVAAGTAGVGGATGFAFGAGASVLVDHHRSESHPEGPGRFDHENGDEHRVEGDAGRDAPPPLQAPAPAQPLPPR